MNPRELSKDFWNNRYVEKNTGWDMGTVSPPLKVYFDQLQNKKAKILIPGCGNSHEAEYLHDSGFKDVFVLDYSPLAIDNFRKRVPSFPVANAICEDFFQHNGKYDLIVEQTFFCAIDPALRSEYARHMHELLNKNGKLTGLLFTDTQGQEGPPYGGTKEEYVSIFKSYFDMKVMETAYNSIEPRKGRELFMILAKKE